MFIVTYLRRCCLFRRHQIFKALFDLRIRRLGVVQTARHIFHGAAARFGTVENIGHSFIGGIFDVVLFQYGDRLL